MIDVIIIKTIDLEDEKLKKICKYVSLDKRNKVDRLLNKNDKVQTIIPEILIRTRLFEDLNSKKIQFNKNEYGKPYIENMEKFLFNISHSGEYIVVAISDSEVGIDIEEIKDIEYIDIARNFFSSEESDYIIGSNKKNGLERFYDVWTLKEAFIKFKGKGLSIPLNSFTIAIDKDKNIRINNSSDYIFNRIHILPGYKLSICSLNNEDLNVEILNQSELINCFLNLVERGIV